MTCFMGSRGSNADEQPVHRVIITKPFYLGMYPVTQSQFAVYDPDHEHAFPDNPNHPAENIDWPQARDWCDRLTANAAQIPDGYSARLPTEAEWEYACSSWYESPSGGRVYTDYHTGDGESALQQAGCFRDNNKHQGTQSVGHFSANRHGLRDMHGNVSEWCLDVYYRTTYRLRPDGVSDPMWDGAGNLYADLFNLPEAQADAGRLVRAGRVFRGGSWGDLASFCRAACRFRGLPGLRGWSLGFRVGLFPVHSCQ